MKFKINNREWTITETSQESIKNMQNNDKMQMKKERVLCKINKNAKRIY